MGHATRETRKNATDQHEVERVREINERGGIGAELALEVQAYKKMHTSRANPSADTMLKTRQAELLSLSWNNAALPELCVDPNEGDNMPLQLGQGPAPSNPPMQLWSSSDLHGNGRFIMIRENHSA